MSRRLKYGSYISGYNPIDFVKATQMIIEDIESNYPADVINYIMPQLCFDEVQIIKIHPRVPLYSYTFMDKYDHKKKMKNIYELIRARPSVLSLERLAFYNLSSRDISIFRTFSNVCF